MFYVEYTQTKGPSQKPINLTKVFGISSNTPNSDTVSKKWHNEAIKGVIKIRHYNHPFTYSKCKRQKINVIWCGLRWPHTNIAGALSHEKAHVLLWSYTVVSLGQVFLSIKKAQ